jgi:hypothetical protein
VSQVLLIPERQLDPASSLKPGGAMISRQSRCAFPSALIVVIILLLILSFSLSPVAHAQSTALLNGTVSDASGAAVPSAKVILKNVATSEEWNTQTNSAGLYVFPSLPPGNYRITVTQAGFQTLVVTDLRLDVATSVTKDLQLTIGSVSQQVQVTTEAPLIETSTTGVGQVINSKTVQEIPTARKQL